MNCPRRKCKGLLRICRVGDPDWHCDTCGEVVPWPKDHTPTQEEQDTMSKKTSKTETEFKTCGSCQAGILIMNEEDNPAIQACDECKLFETDEDAAAAADSLIKMLGEEYRGTQSGDTVAEAMERLQAKTEALDKIGVHVLHLLASIALVLETKQGTTVRERDMVALEEAFNVVLALASNLRPR